MVFGLVSYLTERGESTGASSQRKVEKRAYCPVVTCDTLRLLKERRKGNKAAAWIEKQALQEFGPRKTIDVDNMQAAADDCRRVSRRLTDMLQGLQEHARVPLFWTRERPTRQPDTQHMREGKSIKVENVARICYDMVAAERPEHGSPECQFCGGLIRRCLVATDQAYQCGFGPLGSRRERGGFESFSENQRAVYSIACSLVTLRVIAMELQMPDLADHLYEILLKWCPILAKSLTSGDAPQQGELSRRSATTAERPSAVPPGRHSGTPARRNSVMQSLRPPPDYATAMSVRSECRRW